MRATARGAAQVAAGASWLALVAATTVGVGSLHRVRAAVSVDARKLGHSGVGYRLVVQSYAPKSFALGERNLPTQRARPLGSTQRAVTREELARGVAVDVLGVSETGGTRPSSSPGSNAVSPTSNSTRCKPGRAKTRTTASRAANDAGSPRATSRRAVATPRTA